MAVIQSMNIFYYSLVLCPIAFHLIFNERIGNCGCHMLSMQTSFLPPARGENLVGHCLIVINIQRIPPSEYFTTHVIVVTSSRWKPTLFVGFSLFVIYSWSLYQSSQALRRVSILHSLYIVIQWPTLSLLLSLSTSVYYGRNL
jgi:hypothetical protein